MAVKISDLIDPSAVKLRLEETERIPAIKAVAELLSSNPHVTHFSGFYKDILEREQVEPTCLGNGVALPHARTDHLNRLMVSVGCSEEGILFENCGQTVSLIFVIGTPRQQVAEYLAIVGALARVFREPDFHKELLAAKTSEEFIEMLRDAEEEGF